MNGTKRVYKWWSSWSPGKIEGWLEEMEAEGWHLVKMTRNGLRFEFRQGHPRQIRYAVDYQNKTGPDYRQLFEEIGWELVYNQAGWYVWRKPYSGARPEIYTDLDSLIDRNKRISGVLAILLVLQLPIISINVPNMVRYPVLAIVLAALYIFIIGLLGYGILRMSLANRRLRARNDK